MSDTATGARKNSSACTGGEDDHIEVPGTETPGLGSLDKVVENLTAMRSKSEASKEPKIHYWEKTVEWLFIQKYLPGKVFAAPLASTAELAGDAILRFQNVDSWCLIEFKKDKKCFSDERTKYPAFRDEKWEKSFYLKIEKNVKNEIECIEEGKKELTEEDKNKIKDKVGLLFDEAKKSFERLSASWQTPHVDEKKLPPHIFAYGEFRESNDSIEFNRVMASLKNLKSNLQDKALSSEVDVLQGWIQKNSVDSKNFSTFEIIGESYWGAWCNVGDKVSKVPEGNPVEIKEIREIGWRLENFKSYVNTVVAAKRGVILVAEVGEGAEDERVNWEFGTILGITNDERVVTLSVYDFLAATAILEEKHENSKSHFPLSADGQTPSPH